LFDDEDAVGSDLARFLKENALDRLAGALNDYGVIALDDLKLTTIEAMRADSDVGLTEEEDRLLSEASVKDFKRKLERTNTLILSTAGGASHHLVFISHFKVEAGTEAALMSKDLEKMIQEDPANPGHQFKSAIFLDTEDLEDLRELQSHVRKSHNLILLLTTGVLYRPWVLVEIVTATKAGTRIVPVEVQRPDASGGSTKFPYPDEAYYQRLRKGQELDSGAMGILQTEGITLRDLERAIRQVFSRIAVPFSPHKSNNIRQAELLDIMKLCQLRKGRKREDRNPEKKQSTRVSTASSNIRTTSASCASGNSVASVASNSLALSAVTGGTEETTASRMSPQDVIQEIDEGVREETKDLTEVIKL